MSNTDRYLQILQDDISRILGVPMCVISLDLEAFWETGFRESRRFKTLFPAIDVFRTHLRDLTKDVASGLPKLAQEDDMWSEVLSPSMLAHVYLNRQASPNLFIDALRKYPIWLRWETLWLLSRFGQRNGASASAVCCSNLLYVTHDFLDDSQLLFGPVWTFPDEDPNVGGERFFESTVRIFLDQYDRSIQDIADLVGTPDLEPTDPTALDRLSQLSAIFLEQDFRSTAESAATSLIAVYKAVQGHHLHHCQLLASTQWSLFFEQFRHIHLTNTDQHHYTQDELRFYTRLPVPTPDQVHDAVWLKTRCLPHSQSKRFTLEIVPTPSGQPLSDTVYCSDLSMSVAATAHLVPQFHRHLTRIARPARRRWHDEQLSALQSWLSDRFGASSIAFKQAAVRLPAPLSVYDDLAERIAGLFYVDLATIYFMNYADETLETIGLFHSRGESDLWREAVPYQMRHTGKNFRDRSLSICYRSIDRSRTEFVRDYEPTDPRATQGPTPKAVLLGPRDDLTSSKCAIAAPIMVHGRTIGVLEVNGFKAHQLRWEDRLFAQEIAHAIAPSIHTEVILTAIHELNRTLARTADEGDAAYSSIAGFLGSIFLSQAASIWIRTGSKPGYFSIMGRHNRPDLEHSESPRFPADDESFQVASVCNSDTLWWQSPSPEWLQKRTIDFPKLGFQHLTLIPVRNSKGNAIACLSLYNSRKSRYKSEWENLVQFTSSYAALLLETLHEQRIRESSYRAIVLHDFRGGIGEISNAGLSSIGIARHAKALNQPVQQLSEQLNYLYNRITKRRDHLDKLLAALLTGDVIGIDPDRQYTENMAARASAKVVKVKQVLSPGINSFHELDTKKQKDLTMELPKNLPKDVELAIDDLNFDRLFKILVENAVKYSPPHAPIKIDFVVEKWRYLLKVSNYGMRIPPEDEPHIWSSEVRGSNAAAEGANGTGHGLSAVRSICQHYDMGYYHRQTREPTRGGPNNWWHTFYVTFPTPVEEQNIRG